MREKVKAILALLHEVEEDLLVGRNVDAMKHLQETIRRVVILREES